MRDEQPGGPFFVRGPAPPRPPGEACRVAGRLAPAPPAPPARCGTAGPPAGINLALQDAAAAHPVLLDALHAGDTSRMRLPPYQQRRARTAAAVHRMGADTGPGHRSAAADP
ncbi:hypothetical protein OG250_46535 [Streptomyces sp. NBC_00487]|uniref:hypothetical protein n=1 Tax=unclassified Streptomyces TaxID=2593676 RepID=UPI002DD93185|nr:MULTISPECIES: hypothetical protein [unclassified Streptomyces]WRY93257.1 hypothetical protein OG889_00055 [Streptomyces sp. NBC_00481]WRZ01085.1 hypothetical protein OG889_44285 [Streptomyces sp. NBC_00481]